MKQINIFVDYRNQFYSSVKSPGAAVNLKRLEDFLLTLDYKVQVKSFTEIDFRTQSYKGEWVLYQSSEDPGLFYKSYIEDMIFGMHLQGARLIPDFKFLKAHHNKNFMEVLRDQHELQDIKNISARSYGTYEDYMKDFSKFKEKSYVIKPSPGSRSCGVSSLTSIGDKISIPKKISLTFTFQNVRYWWKKLSQGKDFLPVSLHRRKFIIQEFVSGLKGDYKVVVYGEKYYIFSRENRKNDFRASGSMKFDYLTNVPEGLMDFAERVFKSFNVPYISLDIATRAGEFFLLEFQFLCFGQRAIEKSSYCYLKKGNKWVKKVEIPDLEREIAYSIGSYIKRNS